LYVEDESATEFNAFRRKETDAFAVMSSYIVRTSIKVLYVPLIHLGIKMILEDSHVLLVFCHSLMTYLTEERLKTT
jgi:hypothetical protein